MASLVYGVKRMVPGHPTLAMIPGHCHTHAGFLPLAWIQKGSLCLGGPGFLVFFFVQVGRQPAMQSPDSNQGKHASPADSFCSVPFSHHGSLLWPLTVLGFTLGPATYYKNLGKLLDQEPL